MKYIFTLMAVILLSACQPLATTSHGGSNSPKSSAAKLSPTYTRTTAVATPVKQAPNLVVVPDASNELTINELKFCLNLEQDVISIFEKLSRKDGLITDEYDKLERVVLRMTQIEARAKTDDALRQTYNDLSTQRVIQVNRVLSLFRDRSAIYTRMNFLNEDREKFCKGKKFTHTDMVQACKDIDTTKSFRCNSIF